VRSTESVGGGPPRLAVRYRQTRVGANEPYVLEITEFRAPKVLEVQGRLEEGDVRYHYRLYRASRGRTRLVVTVELSPEDDVTGSRLYAARLEMAVSANLDALKSAIGRVPTEQLRARDE
jgi:hypothetical protein